MRQRHASGGADRRRAKCIDLRTVVPLEVATSLDGAWTDVMLRMCFQHRADRTFGIVPTRFAQSQLLAHDGSRHSQAFPPCWADRRVASSFVPHVCLHKKVFGARIAFAHRVSRFYLWRISG